MTNPDKLKDKVLEVIRENLSDGEIPHSSAEELMDAWEA